MGFVPQIIYTGLDNDGKDLDEALASLAKDMANEKQKHLEGKELNRETPYDDNHAIKKATKAVEEVMKKWMF